MKMIKKIKSVVFNKISIHVLLIFVLIFNLVLTFTLFSEIREMKASVISINQQFNNLNRAQSDTQRGLADIQSALMRIQSLQYRQQGE